MFGSAAAVQPTFGSPSKKGRSSFGGMRATSPTGMMGEDDDDDDGEIDGDGVGRTTGPVVEDNGQRIGMSSGAITLDQVRATSVSLRDATQLTL